MKMIVTGIFSLLLFISCSSVRTFDLIGISGGNVVKNAVLIEDDILRIKVESIENDYDLVAFHLTIRNKSSKYLTIDTGKFYLRDVEAGVFYPLDTDQAFTVIKSHKVFETPLEEMKGKRSLSIAALKSGELPPQSLTTGTLFFEPGYNKIKEVAFVLRGLASEGRVLDFQDIVFQDNAYAYDLKKIKSKKLRDEQKQIDARMKEEKGKPEIKDAQKKAQEIDKKEATSEVQAPNDNW